MNAIVHEGALAQTRLADLGLTYEIIRDAILAGELARSSCTANDPPTIPGTLAWGRTTRRFREDTVLLGWRASEADHLSTCVDPTGTIAVAVTMGDQGTGNPQADPRTKHPKGPATAAAIERNNQQLGLFDAHEPGPTEKPEPSRAVTWLLLIARGEMEIRCELSLPGQIGVDGRIEFWTERIMLNAVPIEPTPNFEKLDEPADFDFDVKRRQSA